MQFATNNLKHNKTFFYFIFLFNLSFVRMRRFFLTLDKIDNLFLV